MPVFRFARRNTHRVVKVRADTLSDARKDLTAREVDRLNKREGLHPGDDDYTTYEDALDGGFFDEWFKLVGRR